MPASILEPYNNHSSFQPPNCYSFGIMQIQECKTVDLKPMIQKPIIWKSVMNACMWFTVKKSLHLNQLFKPYPLYSESCGLLWGSCPTFRQIHWRECPHLHSEAKKCIRLLIYKLNFPSSYTLKLHSAWTIINLDVTVCRTSHSTIHLKAQKLYVMYEWISWL